MSLTNYNSSSHDSNESVGQTLEREEQSKRNAKQWTANEESPVLKTSVKEFTKIDGSTASCSINGIKANARLRVEQDVDLLLKNMKLKILGQPYDEVVIMTDSRYKYYKANEDRIIRKDGLLFRKTFGETQEASNTTKFSFLSNKLKKFYAACMENLASTQDIMEQ